MFRTVMSHPSPFVSVRAQWLGLLIAICVGTSLPLMAATKIVQFPYLGDWTGNGNRGKWGCGGLLPLFQHGTFTVPFNLPTGSKIYDVNITMSMRRSGGYVNPGDADPVVTVWVEGQQIGSPTVVPSYYGCPQVSDLHPYTFDRAFPTGFAANNVNGTNTLTFGVQAPVGTCLYWEGACGVTTGDPVMTMAVTYDPPPPAEFAITSQATEGERRILISNVRTSYAYPHFQSIGSRDAEVTSYLRARDANGNFQPGVIVYLRIADPPDSAPYMNMPGNVIAHTNDNEGAAAILDGPGVTVHSPGVYQATSGANGQVDFTLRLQPPFIAGDNYQIEASSDPSFPGGDTAKSGILTAWKRVFIEKRRMLKNGLFLAQDAMAGDTFIVTLGNGWGGNQGNDKLSKNEKIVITHAPQINRSDLNAGWYYETHTILSVQDLGTGEYRVNLGRKQGNQVIVEQLQHDYTTDTGTIGDGISKIDTLTLGPAHYFDASAGLATGDAFLHAFTENIYLPDTTTPGAMVPVPFIETDLQPTLQDLAEKWSSVVVNGRLLPNHQLLVIGSDNDATPNSAGNAAGVTINQAGATRTSSYVFRNAISDQLTGNNTANEDAWAMKTAAHEIAHQWQTNSIIWQALDPTTTLDHCPHTTKVYDNPNVYCLLASFDSGTSGSVAERTNGIARFHLLPRGTGWHSEYLEIRRRADPFVP